MEQTEEIFVFSNSAVFNPSLWAYRHKQLTSPLYVFITFNFLRSIHNIKIHIRRRLEAYTNGTAAIYLAAHLLQGITEGNNPINSLP